MIDLNKPIRHKRTKELRTIKLNYSYDVYEGEVLMSLNCSIEELDKYYENIPEKEYTFQEACEELIKGNANKFERKDSSSVFIICKFKAIYFVDEKGCNLSQLLDDNDIMRKWIKVK